MLSQTIHPDGLAEHGYVSLVFVGALYRPDSLGESGLYSTTCTQAGSMMAHRMIIRMAIRMAWLWHGCGPSWIQPVCKGLCTGLNPLGI